MSRIVLHALPGRPWGMPNLSPFCGKLETYFRMTDTPYDFVPADPRKAPKGKVPYVMLDGRLMGVARGSAIAIGRISKLARELRAARRCGR